MKLESVFQEIESHEFAAYLNIASNLNTFLRVAFTQEAVRSLCRALDSPECLMKVISRSYELSQKIIDERYENPSDTAMAIYVWTVSLKSLALGKMVADIVLSAPQTWWASRVALKVLHECQTASQTQSDYYTFGEQSNRPQTKDVTKTETTVESLRISLPKRIAIYNLHTNQQQDWSLWSDPAIIEKHNNVDMLQMRRVS